MGPGAQDRRCDDRSDAELLEQIGRQLRMMTTIAFCSSRASLSIACARRAKVRSATTVLVVSTSHDGCTRRLAAVLSIAASF